MLTITPLQPGRHEPVIARLVLESCLEFPTDAEDLDYRLATFAAHRNSAAAAVIDSEATGYTNTVAIFVKTSIGPILDLPRVQLSAHIRAEDTTAHFADAPSPRERCWAAIMLQPRAEEIARAFLSRSTTTAPPLNRAVGGVILVAGMWYVSCNRLLRRPGRTEGSALARSRPRSAASRHPERRRPGARPPPKSRPRTLTTWSNEVAP